MNFSIIPHSYYEKLLATISFYYLFVVVGPFYLPKSILYPCLILIVLVFIFQFFKEKKQGLWFFIDKDIRFVFLFFIVWCIITAFRGLLDDMSLRGIVLIFVEDFKLLCYFTPLLLLLTLRNGTLDLIKKWAFINMFVFLVIDIVFMDIFFATSELDVVQNSDMDMQRYILIAQLLPKGIGFVSIFFIAKGFNKLENKLFLIYLALSILAPLLMGRRSATASVLLYVVLYFVARLKSNKLIIFLVLIGVLIISYLFHFYEKQIELLFPILFSRLDADTRSWIEAEFYRSFDNDTISWIFGRGSLGTFYSNVYGNRSHVETGYLDMILHGGILLLLPYIYILFAGFVRGFFFSRNRMINAMALYLLANLLLLYPGGHMRFDFQAICIWISVACCCSKKMRKSDNALKCNA